MVSTSTTTTELLHDFFPYFRVYKNGRVEKYNSPDFVPPSDDPKTGVISKDVVISPETGVSVRIFIPKAKNPNEKLPLFIHIHGGGFCLGSPSTPIFNNFLTSLASKAKIIIVSVDYRLAPEQPLPIAYQDSWAALQWVASHVENGPETLLNEHADFQRVFIGGESAGANIANDVAIRAGVSELPFGLKLLGLVLVQPYFGAEGVDEMYKFLCPSSSGGNDDLRLNPSADPRLGSLGCRRVMVCLVEKDMFRDRGRSYCDALRKSGWVGEMEIEETEGEGHAFHLFHPECDKAVTQMEWLAAFFNKDLC